MDRSAPAGAPARVAVRGSMLVGALFVVCGAGPLAVGGQAVTAVVSATGSPAPSPTLGAVPCTPALPAGSVVLAVSMPDAQRAAIVRVPANPDGRRLPLAIGFHGYTATAAQLEATSGLSALADTDGFLVAYVQGAGQPTDWTFPGHFGSGADDLTLVSALIDRLIAEACADPSRVILFGHSMGGGMASAAACALADRVAGMVLVSAFWATLPCEPSRPVPVVAMHARDDPVLPYEGGMVGGGGPPVLAVEDVLRVWAERDGCAEEPVARDVADGIVELEWLDCAAPVRLIQAATGGHDWAPSASELIVVMLEPDRKPIGLAERLMALMPAARDGLPTGDFRDWADIEAWAHGIARDLQPAPTAVAAGSCCS